MKEKKQLLEKKEKKQQKLYSGTSKNKEKKQNKATNKQTKLVQFEKEKEPTMAEVLKTNVASNWKFANTTRKKVNSFINPKSATVAQLNKYQR